MVLLNMHMKYNHVGAEGTAKTSPQLCYDMPSSGNHVRLSPPKSNVTISVA